MKLSHCPKYEWKIWKTLPWILGAEFFKFFRSYFGQCDDFISSFWNLLTFNNWNGITFKKPGTVLLMQNVDLGHTNVMKIRQRETLSHQGAIIHKDCCCTAKQYCITYSILISFKNSTLPGHQIQISINQKICFLKSSPQILFFS